MCYMSARKRGRSSVGVRELRQNLSIYLDRVKKGEALTVTEHGAAVALLRPLPTASTALDRLVAQGIAVRPSRALRDRRPVSDVKLDRPLSAILDDLRAERF